MTPLAARVRAFLSPDGAVARDWARFEDRPAQRALAVEVAETVTHGGVLIAEAPTGLGKSLAYLLPAALHAAETGRRIVVSTCTRSLQDQLFERDLPALLHALGLRLRVTRLKGKQNYVCPRALELVEGRGVEEEEALEALRAWAAGDPEGDLDRFDPPDPEAYRRMRGRVCADPDACTLPGCRRERECPWARARREAVDAAFLIVNHALLARAQEVDGLLPDHDVLIVDEAHRLEGVLIGQLARSVSRHRFEEAARLVGSDRGRRAGGLLARVRGYALPLLGGGGTLDEMLDELARRVSRCREDADRFFEAAAPRSAGHAVYGVRERYRSAEALLDRDLEPLEVLLQDCSGIARGLARLAAAFGVERDPGAETLVGELEQVGARWSSLGTDLERIADAADPGWVYWRASSGRGLELNAAPVDVGGFARTLVPGRARAAVLTSATLSTGGDVSFLAERLGLGERWGVPYEARIHESPFALERQTRAFVYEGGGDEARDVAALVETLAAASVRNTLVLFTAHERLRRARAALLHRLPPGRVLLAQDLDGPAGLLAERFRATRGAILLGVQSLWEGVDFPGDALEILIVAKLPFSVPDEPIVEARAERLTARGLDPFQHDVIPEAVLRFRQGVGRLIRRADDRGVLIVCDPRMATASYRRAFLETLAVTPERVADAATLAREAEGFLSGERSVEERV